jgi:hypothetical protein
VDVGVGVAVIVGVAVFVAVGVGLKVGVGVTVGVGVAYASHTQPFGTSTDVQLWYAGQKPSHEGYPFPPVHGPPGYTGVDVAVGVGVADSVGVGVGVSVGVAVVVGVGVGRKSSARELYSAAVR